MSGARERILQRVAGALAGLPKRVARPLEGPSIASAQSARILADWELFVDRFTAVHGVVLQDADALAALVAREGWRRGYCAPECFVEVRAWLPENVALETTFERSRLDEFDFGISRAEAAVAETGTLVLADRSTPERLGALAPWAHIALLPKTNVVRTVAEAVKALPNDGNVIWVTGPSKTADVEGILIEGVHGPGIQAVLGV